VKITKFVHSCLLVETPERVALFDPGTFSEEALDVSKIDRLDDIFITHEHADHCSPDLIKQLVGKFPNVRITSTSDVVKQLSEQGIKASDQAPEGVAFFEAPHESIAPNPTPQNIGIHYLDKLSDPGDSHSFHETKTILALPITAPWGSSERALELVLELKPKHVLPIHDWHWDEATRATSYDNFERVLGEHSITFYKLQTGIPVEIPV
jgi:L-ascorbate metabolism protein UlaG (beta-lactamase superfamily)